MHLMVTFTRLTEMLQVRKNLNPPYIFDGTEVNLMKTKSQASTKNEEDVCGASIR